MFPLNSISIFALFVSLLAILVGSYLWKRSQGKTSKVTTDKLAKLKPEKWIEVGKVKKLILYPVKSCAGLVLDEAILTRLGLKCPNANIRDRDFMLVNELGKPVTMDNYPKMALIKFDIQEGDKLTVTAPNMPPFTFTPPTPNETNERLCKVTHDRGVKVLDCGDEVSQWFQEYLENSSFRLYYHHLNETQRTLMTYMTKCPLYVQSDLGSFQNETSYLLVAEESIEKFNKYLVKESTWKNWRPQVLIDGVSEPFAEVNWSFVKIGNKGVLKTAIPCARCPLTAVDNDLGVMSEDGEPFNTLKKTYGMELVVHEGVKKLKILKNKGLMGTRMGLYLPAGEGHVIKTGDPVYASVD